MAIDGSFRIEYELERFLRRCPKLAAASELVKLVKKGKSLTEEELIDGVAELLLHPRYTIPLVGCFRPIARKIVDRSVALLRLVPDLTSNSSDLMLEFDEGRLFKDTESSECEEVICVINVYVKHERGLKLHELACLAFSRTLDLLPYLSGSIRNYFSFAPPPFKRITGKESMSHLLMQEGVHLLDAMRVSYRLLLAEPEFFSRLWDWSCFLDLLHEITSFNGENTELLMDIRWCVVQILTVVLKMSDRFVRKKKSDMTAPDFGFDDEVAFACLLRWKEFLQDVSLEKAGWYLEPFRESGSCSSEEDINLGLGPSNWSDMEATWDMSKSGRPFVVTSAVKKSFEMVWLAVSQRWPVLLYGPAGAGKTALISKLAHAQGSQVLSIHMDEQIDGKTLIGSYVCAEQPGEFRWQPGSLTQAILNGLWVVFEDIDKAPADVQSILLPLLEGSTSFLTGHGEAVKVSESFRLFSTVSSSRLDASTVTTATNSLGALWRRVMVSPPSRNDLLSIVKAWYPDLESICGKLIETFEKVNQLAGYQLGTSVAFSSTGRFSLRDLLKWCKRIVGLGYRFAGDNLSVDVAKCIYQEAVDVFATSSSSVEMRLRIMKELSEIWKIHISNANTLFPVDKPLVKDLRSEVHIGRVALQRTGKLKSPHVIKSFVEIRTSLHILERIAGSVKYNEPVLLVGETGTGKTTMVQHLAARIGQKLTVLNLSQQSDVADLLGGFKPMDAQFLCLPLYKDFETLFRRTFSSKDNESFLAILRKFVSDKNWNRLLNGLQKGVRKVVEIGKKTPGGKRKRPLSEELVKKWDKLSLRLDAAQSQISSSDGMVFSFVEGIFITALKKGEWILLDEVNLAPPETLQRVIGVLEDESGSLCLAERGDVDYISRNPNFRIFACMNPATDAGKRDLPLSLRSRFTEYFMDDVLEDKDLELFINEFIGADGSIKDITSKVLKFYKMAKKESEERLQDGANQKPQYSLRSLYRALEYTKKARHKFDISKAIYDGFSMFFLTMLDPPSAKLMNSLIVEHLLDKKVAPHVSFDKYITGPKNFKSNDFVDNYQLTDSVKGQLSNLGRAVFIGRYPVLLQGPTSSGKTSLVQYLAAITGHEFVRINNHEHTDLQEYLGSYITDATGKLVFQEGVLVKAVRHGYWIVLDELNLAPSDVLEALNRLLDDNRELYVPELCETIHAHKDFMLFATQNPPTFYGGRKMLSRAFRNRFVEIHVDEIPQNELITILEKRCKIAPTYAKKMIDVMKDLQLRRQSSKVFAGKHGFITPRDLFRWADRYRMFGTSYEDLGRDGYYLLAERLRDDVEKKVVLEVLEKHLRIKLSSSLMYKEGNADLKLQNSLVASGDLGRVVWTDSLWRLYFLVERCYRLREPVLLVGETGGGKTTVCQLLSIALGSKLHILNCHQYTETSDFLGGFYPVRERSELGSDFKVLCEQLLQSKAFKHFPLDAKISFDINQASTTLDQVNKVIKCYREGQILHADVTCDEINYIEETIERLSLLHKRWSTIFNWQDGPLVQAMKNGDLFLVDEISLADDSVLERLNSVLEPERKLSLAEKGGADLEKITAHEKFFVLATMNPGGDFGKKELSPALRNRFTEIWVPPVSELNELKCIASEKILNPKLSFVADVMINFWEWFNRLQMGRTLTVRDLLSWIDFINVTEKSLHPEVALLHGAFLVLLDGLSLGTGISKIEADDLRERCLSFLMEQLKANLSMTEYNDWSNLLKSAEVPPNSGMEIDSSFGIHPFYIEKGNNRLQAEGFEFLAPTTRRNSLRVLRAMQLKKPVLLEGSPGVGKTSLILALGKFSGHSVVRINLSEQTDMMDLLGSDLPVESDEGMQFAWSDGILLQALKNGSWVLLDELNLAPQSVLEGLNAILDHRAEVFIPELGRTFKCPSSFRVFACQNPSNQGGGRKGLPKSFLNRFTKVYVDELVEKDHLFICRSLYPSIQESLIVKLIAFNKRLYEDTMISHKFGQSGFPWEFNLRDIIRSCQIIEGAPGSAKNDCFLNTVYVQRMRSSTDRQEVINLYKQVFGVKPVINLYPRVQLDPENLIVGNTYVKRNNTKASALSLCELKILPGQRQSLESVAQCLHHQWLVLLIGPAASGKTSLIRLMSQLTGNVLNELSLSSATDISELLGCFEQYNAIRHYRLAIDQVDRYMNACMSVKTFTKRKSLISRWLSFSSTIDHGSASFVTASVEKWNHGVFHSLPLLIDIIEDLKLVLESDSEDLDRLLKVVTKLQDDQRKLLYPAKFEWVTGLLIKAIENGEWIVLENANLCNPTVLDRINSLVEQSGSITVNECGTIEGKPLTLRPHPQFRMFLTVNPTYGEVSRAMRNRGVEIFLMRPYGKIGLTDYENELKDVKRFLALSNIPGEFLVNAMAKSHLSVKEIGLQHDVRISNVELMRWVQLFQRLVTNGNQALWSLKISFEHTYLSSLGHTEGKYIINETLSSYLSMHEVYNYGSSPDSSLCLPGGWPTVLTVCDFVRYSVETSVKQNCMHVEYLGAQMASHSFRDAFGSRKIEQVQCHSDSMRTYVTDVGLLHDMAYPKADVAGLHTVNQTRFDAAHLYKKLLFAANWTIEQATEADLKVYLLWFRWLSDHLQGHCSFFSSFLKLLNQELDHPIWHCIRMCRDVDNSDSISSNSTPMLSLEYANLNAMVSESSSQLLKKAVKCVELLRVSYQQWQAESEFNLNHGESEFKYRAVLLSLRNLEEKILVTIVESPFFDTLFELYKKLIGDHISAWNGLVSSQFDCMLISWRSLVKDARKLKEFCPNEVEVFQNDMKDLERDFSWNLNSRRSLLWVYGGHPFTPSSVEIYNKQKQLVNLCHTIWSREMPLQELAQKDSTETAVSTNPELRFLAMQGVCMSAFIMSKVDEDNLDVLKQMEDMYQMLLSKFHHEKDKLERNKSTNEQASSFGALSSCCVMNADMLCQPSGFSCRLDTLPLNDYSSFGLDMMLLQELSNIVVLDRTKLESGLSCLRWRLESTMQFSLDSSSRPPTDFSPHQKLLWVLDAWASVNPAQSSISSTVNEMWFNWHTSLWKHHLNCEKTNLVPDMLFQPVATLSLDKILQSTVGIDDFNAHSLKLGIASRILWLSSPHVAECRSFFVSSARSLFQQIILAHEKSFEADKYSLIKSEFSAQQVDVNRFMSLLTSSTHSVLKSSIEPFIIPLLHELYSQNSTESLFNLGSAWLRLGGLRYRLLVCCDDVDPAVKKNFKYIQLTERIASLELDIQVREECVYLAGCFSLSEADKEKERLLNNLKNERNKLQRQVVFRSDPRKFKKLRSECEEFMKWVVMPFADFGVADIHNWQETATRFVDRLSNEYSEYVDIVQPVQIAIYEMKLGLSLVLSNRLRDQYLDRVGQRNIDVVLGALYSFIRFPRGMGRKYVTIIEDDLIDFNAKLSYFDESFPTYMGEDDMKMVKTLVTVARDNNKDEEVSILQLKASIHKNSLLRVVHYVATAHFLDNASFELLEKMFNRFAKLYVKMKTQMRIKEELDSQQFQFKPRAFDIKNVIEIDVSTLESSIANEAFSEWQELATEEVEVSLEKNNVGDEDGILEKDWNLLLESMLNEMVNLFCTLFGSTDLLQPVGFVQLSDSDRLCSFLDSYTLGTRVLKDLKGLLCSSLDSKIIPEHVLRLCLEHDKNFNSSRLLKSSYNFYKDSNASMLAKMVGPVMDLRQRIRHLMSEWDDHPALQKIVDVIDMILSIPMNTPLAKAMSGLQFLLNRVRNLQETVSKFPLSDQLDPIVSLVSSWQKMEFESWPALLDEVQARFDTNAGQLWFPLHSVLQKCSVDALDTMQSLKEFVETSSIGEFKKRLQLLFAFHGHISTEICQKSSSSLGHEDNVKILYNTFGYYIQFLPIIMEQLASNRKNIVEELKELLKLCKWERNEWYMTMETSKRTREKFKKLIQKYTDVLKQPVMFIINQAIGQSGLKTLAANDRTLFCNSFVKYKPVLDVACQVIHLGNEKRFIWPSTWRNKVDLALGDMRAAHFKKPDRTCVQLHEAEENIDIIRKSIDNLSLSDVTKEEWDVIQYTFETISTNIIYCGERWKEEKKSLLKRRALAELLKLLDSCGLAKHRPASNEDQSVKNKSRFFQPSYIMEHLLLNESRLSSGNVDVASKEKAQSLAMDNLETIWKAANEYFFKSMSSFGRLQDVCSNFHKDFTKEQAEVAVSYLDHLVEIQKSHRADAYDLAKGLELLKKHSLPLQSLFSSSSGGSFSHNQGIVSNCMWRQKQLFDTMCNSLDDECLLLKSVENNHLNNCQSVGAAAKQIHRFLEEFALKFKKSKETLDSYLFGDCGSLISTSVVLHPYGITKEMEQFVQQNFTLIKGFKEELLAIREQDLHAGLAKNVLLDHFNDIITNGNLLNEYYNSALKERNQPEKVHDADDISRAEVRFTESLRKTCKQIVDSFDRVNSVNNRVEHSEDYLRNINTWQNLFASRVESLQLHAINDELVETLNSAGKLIDLYGNEQASIDLVEAQLKHLYSLLDLMINFGNGLLNDFMVVHSTLSMVTHALAEIFASLYSQGFGCATENEEEDSGTQDATGTGMGEGAGVKDVSDQIEDEDQLLGTEKGGEEQDALNDVPSKNDKGIEMEQDFNADAFSVSEDETDDENEDENDEPELDSAMGETGDDSNIVDEKLGENKDDENDENPEKNEKYETGPSVKDNDPNGRELRAKEDDVAATDEAGELDADESNKQNDENDDNGPDDGNDVEDMNVDKDEAFSEPTGLKPDEPNVDPDDDTDMNQQDDVDHNEDEGTETVDESADGEEEEADHKEEETGPDALTENVDMETEAEEADQENQQDSKTDADMDEQKNDVTAPVANNFDTEHQQNYESATQPNSGSNGASMRNVSSEVTWSNTDDMQSELAPIQGLPNSSQNEVSVAGSSKAGELNDEHIGQPPEVDPSSLQKSEPNPLRNIGDALEGWKERAKVSVDLEDKKNDPMDDMDGGDEDQDADEYGFTSGLDTGTAQALGSAAADQVDKNIDRKEPVDGDGDGGPADQKDDVEMDIEDQHHEAQPVKNYPLKNIGNTIHDKMEVEETEILDEAPEVFNPLEDGDRSQLESSVFVKRSYMTDDVSHFGQLSVVDDDMGKSHNLEDVPAEMKDSASALWRKYESQTTRLSQELAEQLRLVMEPTLASKLQGDYKTGKRINMKKVIPYIASHYRKDKIWLRRTRPNKRNYQVVIAVDDSRSMSENNCGNAAIEALVTVCRAMSQLEVGNLAVASFGKKGNIKLLHDFDQPFTGESGVKMVSSLTFKQENTIVDEPMVDLLKYLNNKLDSAVINARLPSGQNPLEQLVLIIADGRLNEKENLKRRVRDILSQKRMVAFLLLDNPKDSITEVMDASFKDGKCVSLVKYMDSFPFPFYVVLKDLESLPRTLADLLRQWFELMQHSRA
ncbi:putative von Willebrand factor, type A, AAA+ ATPase domain, midasin, midasin, AAA lid domain 7 [Helianthus annuus]|nr:putative von Willebrand factor, type A, AAA+ ATPase domain, midasin, midasin, AAA lid domain 7 [Helianthus annuus]